MKNLDYVELLKSVEYPNLVCKFHSKQNVVVEPVLLILYKELDNSDGKFDKYTISNLCQRQYVYKSENDLEYSYDLKLLRFLKPLPKTKKKYLPSIRKIHDTFKNDFVLKELMTMFCSNEFENTTFLIEDSQNYFFVS